MKRHVWFFLIFMVVLGIGGIILYFNQDRALFRLDLSHTRMLMENRPSEVGIGDLQVTSGGVLTIDGQLKIAHSATGDTLITDPWYIPGTHTSEDKRIRPQLAFRAIVPGDSAVVWEDYVVKMIIIPRVHLIRDPENASRTDGIFLFARYLDQNRLYVAGLSKDCRMFIKKKSVLPNKIAAYGLLAEIPICTGNYQSNGNLLHPFEDAIYALSLAVQNLQDGSVELHLRVSISENGKEVFSKLVSGVDDGNVVSQGTPQNIGAPWRRGTAGIRTDSIEFDILEFRVMPYEDIR